MEWKVKRTKSDPQSETDAEAIARLYTTPVSADESSTDSLQSASALLQLWLNHQEPAERLAIARQLRLRLRKNFVFL